MLKINFYALPINEIYLDLVLRNRVFCQMLLWMGVLVLLLAKLIIIKKEGKKQGL